MSEALQELQSRYKKSTLTKKELSIELNVSQQTIDRNIKNKIGVPNYIRTSTGKNASYLFPIVEVAKFLDTTIKTL